MRKNASFLTVLRDNCRKYPCRYRNQRVNGRSSSANTYTLRRSTAAWRIIPDYICKQSSSLEKHRSPATTRPGCYAAPLRGAAQRALLAARVAYGLGYSRRCRFPFHYYSPRNDRQRERALHSPAKRCRVVAAWPGCCQAVVRARESLLAVIARAKQSSNTLSTPIIAIFVRQKAKSTHKWSWN